MNSQEHNNCPLCGSKRITNSTRKQAFGSNPELDKHLRRCERATETERRYFQRHRKWPSEYR